MQRVLAFTTLIVLLGLGGCATRFSEKAQYGITFYCPGAGNIDFGDQGVRQGLEGAGYPGQVGSITWTVSFNPAIDQTLRLNAHFGAAALAGNIEKYIDTYPGQSVNVIGLSAGTGVAVWALEKLDDGYKVDNVVLLSSSLYHKYDLGKALPRVKGKIYNYYSANDIVLAGPMKFFGTIDGVPLVDGAGAVGFADTHGGRVENIAWRPEFDQYGYHGGHTDATSPGFVRAFLSRHIIHDRQAAPRTDVAMRSAAALADARPD